MLIESIPHTSLLRLEAWMLLTTDVKGSTFIVFMIDGNVCHYISV